MSSPQLGANYLEYMFVFLQSEQEHCLFAHFLLLIRQHHKILGWKSSAVKPCNFLPCLGLSTILLSCLSTFSKTVLRFSLDLFKGRQCVGLCGFLCSLATRSRVTLENAVGLSLALIWLLFEIDLVFLSVTFLLHGKRQYSQQFLLRDSEGFCR